MGALLPALASLLSVWRLWPFDLISVAAECLFMTMWR